MKGTAIPDDFVVCQIPDGQFADMVGPLYVRRDTTGTSYGFRVEARHGNVRGNIHGGMLMTLADQILGLTVVEALGHMSLATISLNNEFVAGANIGDWLVGRADIIRRTRSLVFIRGVILRDQDTVLNSSGIWRHFSS
ncbi:MAG: PaaI family thioesterase [Fimbriimonadaceae bacterium]|nr:PaaI family thioesterase [Alphaproteobacteria bacterium]